MAAANTNPLFQLRDAGQSPWLDYIRRGLITSGGLKRFVDEFAVSGVTSNPTILNRAITGSTDYDEALRSLAAGPGQALATLLWDGRFSLLTAVLAGFGRAVAEVGAVMIVGGNINHATRVMTTAIALETSKGNLALALGLGMILIVLALTVNLAALALRDVARAQHA